MQEHLIWVILAVTILVGTLVPGFLKPLNLLNVLWAASPLGCMVLGMLFVMLVGGIDLSLESTFGFASVIAVVLMMSSIPGRFAFGLIPAPVALVVALGIGALVGLVNGLISVKLRVVPFLVTLAMLLVLRGAVIYLVPEGVYYLPDAFTVFGRLKFDDVPISIGVLLILYVVGYIILNHTSLGKNIYAIGNNEDAAFVAGINVERVKIFMYVLAGFFAAFGGLIDAGRIQAVHADMGKDEIMMVLAATVLGGTSMTGGAGSITGIFAALMVISIIENIMNLIGVDPSIREVIFGLILMLAIVLASLQGRTKRGVH